MIEKYFREEEKRFFTPILNVLLLKLNRGDDRLVAANLAEKFFDSPRSEQEQSR